MEIAVVFGRYVFSIVLLPKHHFLLGIWYEKEQYEKYSVALFYLGFALFWFVIRRYEKTH